jgi:Ethanolamine utilization protein EutJ (predicted chaperonin)
MAKISINIATGSLQQQEMIVGIDLGTTNSLVAIIHPETKQPVALRCPGLFDYGATANYFFCQTVDG